MQKDKQEVVEKIDLQLSGAPEYFGVKSPIMKSIAKYRKEWKEDPDNNKDLKYGMYCVLRQMDKMSVEGYYLCRILDWESQDSWWSPRTRLYYVIVESSFAGGDVNIGRIVSTIVSDRGYAFCSDTKSFVSFGKSDFPIRRN